VLVRQRTARQVGWAACTHVYPVGVGAEWITCRARTDFGVPGRYLLDLCHVGGYLAADGPAGEADYRSRQKSALCQGRSESVIAELVARIPISLTSATSSTIRAPSRVVLNPKRTLMIFRT
jgi:hypothetical protein